MAGTIAAATGCRPANFNNQHEARSIYSVNPLIDDKKSLASKKQFFLGYPLNLNTPPDDFFTWRNELRKVGIGDFGFNNVGNPYAHSSIEFNTHEFEKQIISRFGKIYGFPAADTWGFLSHSGTDSNMHGMYLGRTILKSLTGEMPICCFTREAHYSIQILSDLLGLRSVFINALPDASMDVDDLNIKLAQNPNHPALVVATIGTTFKGGIDHMDRIQAILKRRSSYLHLDAALFGGYLPHIEGGTEMLSAINQQNTLPRFDSIAVSCHKFFGYPSPAGLFITTQSNFDIFHEAYSRIHNPEYIGHVPGTITCSRDAVKPAEFHYFSSQQALARQSLDAKEILKNTSYLMDQMQTHFQGLHPIRSSKLSNTIYFKKPPDEIVKKYSLATMHLFDNDEQEDFAHVVVMPHASRGVLDEFLADLNTRRSIEVG